MYSKRDDSPFGSMGVSKFFSHDNKKLTRGTWAIDINGPETLELLGYKGRKMESGLGGMEDWGCRFLYAHISLNRQELG